MMTLFRIMTAGAALAMTIGTASAQLSNSLQRMDANNDGKLSPDEWAADRPALLKKLDANKDGAVTQDEASAFYEKASKGDGKAGDRTAKVMRADVNGDGRVTAEEMRTAADVEFRKRDRNGDGFIGGDDAKK